MSHVALYEHYDADRGVWTQFTQTTTLRIEPEMDLALLDYRPIWFASVAPGSPPIGEPITVVGHPGGLAYTCHRGHVSSPVRRSPGRPGEWYQVDAGILPGASGGPVLNERGEVVGIASFTLSGFGGLVPHPHLGGVVARDAIARFLEE